MGYGYIIGCNNCINESSLKDYYTGEKINGTVFNIAIGGGMLLFCKEQLEKWYGINKKHNRKYRLLAAGDPPDEIYKTLGSATNDELIDKKIYENIKNGFDFTEILGDLPYYCETCKKLFNHFYFQMNKSNILYTPNYICKNCNNILEPACLVWEKRDGDNDDLEDDCKNDIFSISYNFNIIKQNNLIKIESKEGIEKEIICDYCKNKKFTIFSKYYFD